MYHFSYFSFSSGTLDITSQTALRTEQASPPKQAMNRAILPVPSAVPANDQMLGLILTPVKVQVILWHQVHIVEYEAVPIFILESF